MDSRRDFLKKAALLSGGLAMQNGLPLVIQKALDISPEKGSSFYDAEHVVFLMQENRSFDHQLGMLQGVRGFNDPRAIQMPDKNLVWLQTDQHGNTFAPFRLDRKQTKIAWMGSLPHGWSDQTDALNEGRHDRWLQVKQSRNKEYRDMPLTLGYGERSDFPFYYSLADAFTVCDQNFCSSLTGTHPNRFYWMTGTVRDRNLPEGVAHLWNFGNPNSPELTWSTYPERLEENGISWKIYQNELSLGRGLTREEGSWLGNFGTNVLEYFVQYNVRLHEGGLAGLKEGKEKLQRQISELEGQKGDSSAAQRLVAAKRLMNNVEAAEKKYTQESFDRLSQFQKNINSHAFNTNIGDPDFHKLSALQYNDKGTERTLNVPKGDIFHQFRQDVKSGNLPTVSWLMSPGNFSDHPGNPWFGPWYVSEAMEILLENPAVWKKTIFILAYDENDGFYDHIPPYTIPNPFKPHSGKVSSNIDPKMEWVTPAQQTNPSADTSRIREGSIGMGYRVPLIIASPWTRGGFVCSELFDHTSSLQFLERFLEKKTGKKVIGENITQWRRSVCGDLTSAFRPYNGEKIAKPQFLSRDQFIEDIHQAQFKQSPENFKKLNANEQALINQHPRQSPYFPQQEKGVRPATPVPYELYTNGQFHFSKGVFQLNFKAGDRVFGKQSAGSPFRVYAMAPYQGELLRTWSYAATAGDTLSDEWVLADFQNQAYALRVYAPNGFYREFRGNMNNPHILVRCEYEEGLGKGGKLTGNILVNISNNDKQAHHIRIDDNSYGRPGRQFTIAPSSSVKTVLKIADSYCWYDFSVKLDAFPHFEERFAGRVETGAVSKTDPLMGGLLEKKS